MTAQFCATGREGLTRNLTAAEIIAQVALVQEDFQEQSAAMSLLWVREPFLNYDGDSCRFAHSKQPGRFQYRSETYHALYLRKHYRWDRSSLTRARAIHARRVSSFGTEEA